jgi:hypothetical protein
MAKSTKIGPQKPRFLGNPEARKDKVNKVARETRAFNKAKLEKEDAQRNSTVRVAKRPEKKVK